MMTSAASVSRSNVSHHGVRDGVSSLGAISNSSRVGGKLMRRGRGGTSRSSHHKTGRPSRPSSTSGCAKPSGRATADHATLPGCAGVWRLLTDVVCIWAPMRECSTSSNSLAGRSVRWTAKLQPSRSVSARICRAVARHQALVVVAPGLGAAGGDAAGAFRLDEFDAARIGEAFLGRIDDLHDMAMRAGGGELGDGSAAPRRSGSTGRTASRSRRAATARTTAAGWRAPADRAGSPAPFSRSRCGWRSGASGRECRPARRPAPALRPRRRPPPARARACCR